MTSLRLVLAVGHTSINSAPDIFLGIFCAIFSVYFGFRATMLVAVLAYMLAWYVYRGLYSSYLADQQQQA